MAHKEKRLIPVRDTDGHRHLIDVDAIVDINEFPQTTEGDAVGKINTRVFFEGERSVFCELPLKFWAAVGFHRGLVSANDVQLVKEGKSRNDVKTADAP